MRFDSVGIDPELAVSYAAHLYDQGESDVAKVKILINNIPPPLTQAKNSPNQLTSNRSIDINVGEMLGIGVVGMYYNYIGAWDNHTYQSVVGVEDSSKRYIETLLSDGAIWSNRDKNRMMFQQVMAQGYLPQSKKIDTNMLIKAIDHKVAMRNNYPENCGLIVNLFSESGDIDFKEVASRCDLKSYNIVLVNVYDLPGLKQAICWDLNPDDIKANIPPKTLTVGIERNFLNSEWTYNFDDARIKSNSTKAEESH